MVITFPLFDFLHGRHNQLLLIIFLLIQHTTAQQLVPTAQPTHEEDRKSMAIMMAVVAILFLISALLSIYNSQCGANQPTSQTTRETRGLNPEIIQTFPSFRYAAVKPLMIQRDNLACAVCLDDFNDDDTLRFIPNCSHVFHLTCIDVWLHSHSTCPVCRACLTDEVTPFVAIPIIPDEQRANGTVTDELELRKNENRLNRSRTVSEKRSRSSGFLLGVLFRRCNTTGHDEDRTVGIEVKDGNKWERYTLRLPEEVRREMVMNCSRLKRARSCVSFRRMSSGRISGYRTRSVGSELGRNNYYYYERLHFHHSHDEQH